MGNRFAVVHAPGFGDHELKIYSAHKSSELAKKAASKHDYKEPGTGCHTKPACVIKVDYDVRKGDVVWADTCGRSVWEYV